MFLHEFLDNSAEKFSESVYLIHNDEFFTYKKIYSWSNNVARWLINNGIKKGDRVLMIMENSPYYVASYYGIIKAGGVVAAVNPDNVAKEIMYLINDSQAFAVIADRHTFKWLPSALPEGKLANIIGVTANKYPEELSVNHKVFIMDEIVNKNSDNSKITGYQNNPDDLASIIYTSGTTGKPKGVMLSHNNLIENTNSIIEYLKLTSEDRVMAVLPFFYSYGNSLLQTHTAIGGSIVIHNGFAFPNIIIEKMIKNSCTGFAGVPSTYALLMHRSTFKEHKYPLLRYVTIAGGGLPPASTKELIDIIKPASVIPMYGQTEASARLSYLPTEKLDAKLGSIGIAIPGVTLKVLREDGSPVKPGGETGEIVAQGKNVMLGYWNQHEETKKVLRQEGLWTGDMAWIDEDGFIFIVARKKDIIKTGAYRVSPAHIEEILAEHPAVAESSVVGEPDQLLGEAIVAFIVPKPDIKPDPKELAYHCRQRLVSYEVPKRFEIVESLPKTTSGKIKKHELRDMLAKKMRANQ